MTENDDTNNNMASNGSGYNNVFNRIEKFSGKGDTDFASWLRTFDRACTIAQKTDDLVKGQLMMLCLTGQAIAAAEQLEEEKNAQQPYSALKVQLESVFNTTANKESRMVEFDKRCQRVEESEDEFMLALVRLYKAANPDADDNTASLAIKRKFMQGISTELRRSTYIFCTEPFATTVTYQQLLESARKARLQLTPAEPSSATGASEYVTNVAEAPSSSNSETQMMQAINNLANNFSSLNERLDTMERCYNNQHADINSVNNNNNNNNRFSSNNRYNNNAPYNNNNRYINSNQRGRRNNRNVSWNRNDRRNDGSWNRSDSRNDGPWTRSDSRNDGSLNRNNNRNDGPWNSNDSRNEPIVCYNCQGLHHRARDCTKN